MTSNPDRRPRSVIVFAPFLNIADAYCRTVGATRETHRVVTDPDRLRALSPRDKVIVVQAHDPGHVLSRGDHFLRVSRADVTYVDIDTIMGVKRDG